MAKVLKLFDEASAECPVIAILRGVTPDEVVPITEALFEQGLRIVEVPLNSPDPYASIAALSKGFAGRMVVGAGTVVSVEQAEKVAEVGGQICVSPNCNPAVIAAVLERGMLPVPGVATASEAFQAIAAGAIRLKAFPAGSIGLETISAWNAVLPDHVSIFATGGIVPNAISGMLRAGCAGIGIGADLYRAGSSVAEVSARAKNILGKLPSLASPREVSVCAKSATSVGDSLVCDPISGDLLWIDLVERTLHCYSPTDELHTVTSLSQQLTGLVAASDGRLFGCTEDGVASVDRKSGYVTPFAKVNHRHSGMRLNDAAIDRRGRIWSGSMCKGLLGGRAELFMIDTEGQSRVMLDGLGICNGLGFSHDGRALFLIDTANRTLLRAAVNADTGDLQELAVVTDFGTVPGKPDGLHVSEDDTVWIAMWNGSCVVRIDGQGRVLERVEIGVPLPSSCAVSLEGDLFVSTSRLRLGEDELAAAPASGHLFRVTLPKDRQPSALGAAKIPA